MEPVYSVMLAGHPVSTIGAPWLLIRRTRIVLFMCIQLILNAGNLALVTFSRITANLDGRSWRSSSWSVVAAAEVVGRPQPSSWSIFRRDAPRVSTTATCGVLRDECTRLSLGRHGGPWRVCWPPSGC